MFICVYVKFMMYHDVWKKITVKVQFLWHIFVALSIMHYLKNLYIHFNI